MEIYLIRHGETGGNVAHRHQHEETPLTDQGRDQAALVAKRIAKMQPTHIFVSDRVRSIQTGMAIGMATGLTPETDRLFSELLRPQTLYGYKHRSFRSLWYLFRWYTGLLSSSDDPAIGESYQALRERILSTQLFLSTLPQDAKVVVVSHAVFISMFAGHMNHPRPLSVLGAARTFWHLRKLRNTAITTIRLDADGQWQLVSWNDSSHLS